MDNKNLEFGFESDPKILWQQLHIAYRCARKYYGHLTSQFPSKRVQWNCYKAIHGTTEITSLKASVALNDTGTKFMKKYIGALRGEKVRFKRTQHLSVTHKNG
jgi:hypothetical protein